MEEKLQRITVGEMKFRSMVNDLMVMERPGMTIYCPSSSKARSLRRQFYNWTKNLAEMERNFMSNVEFKLLGRIITVAPKADWLPVETSANTENVNAPDSQGESA